MVAPLPDGEDARLADLREYRILGTAPEDTYDDITRLAAYICGTPIAAVTFIDAECQWFKSVVGLFATETPRDMAFCAHTILQPGLMVVPDAKEDSRFADNPLVTGDPNIRFYAGMPLISETGHALGALCVIDKKPRTLTHEQEVALKTLAHQVASQLELGKQGALQRRLNAEREEADEVLQQKVEELSAVVEQVMDAVFVFDPITRRLLKTNATFRAMFGYSEGQAATLMLYDLVADSRESVDRNIEALMEGKEVLLGERQYLRRDASVVVLEVKGRLIRYGGGEACCVVAHDITERRQAEERLRQNEARLVEAQRIAHVGSWELDLISGKRAWSEELFLICGLDPAQGPPDMATQRACYHPEDLAHHDQALAEMLATGQASEIDVRAVRPSGEERWCHLTARPVLGATGQIVRVVGTAADITERVASEQELRRSHERLTESEARLRLALESGNLGSYEMDQSSGQFLDVSDTYKAHFGLPPEAEFSLARLISMIHPDDREPMREIVERSNAAGRGFQAEHRLIWPDGTVHWISAHGTPLYGVPGQSPRLIGVTQDVTTRKQQEAEREMVLAEALERADRDPLTGLLNHRAFHKRLEEETSRALRQGTPLAVVMLDLDNFKFFNDVYSHLQGDDVLRQVAARLQATCRPEDTLARFGGDEFALLLPGILHAGPDEIEARMWAGLGNLAYRPIGSMTAIPITVSVGAALFMNSDADGQEVLKQADERLLRAKTGGGGETEADRVRAQAAGSMTDFSMLDALVTAVDNKDRYTRKHSEDVMNYSLMIARALGMDEKTQHTISVAALLHDVGKIGVPDYILRKPGKLTDEEFASVKQHPQMGAVMVGAVPGLENTLDAVRHHHERWDGKGYPFGLCGEETPLMARLMAVADAYSAMTTDRPYRQGMGAAKALSILLEGAGTQWDPECVAAFVATQQELGPDTSSAAIPSSGSFGTVTAIGLGGS